MVWKGEILLVRRVLDKGILSPFLFVLVADVFTIIFDQGRDLCLIKRLENFENGIIFLQYVDTLPFSVLNGEKLRNLSVTVSF